MFFYNTSSSNNAGIDQPHLVCQMITSIKGSMECLIKLINVVLFLLGVSA